MESESEEERKSIPPSMLDSEEDDKEKEIRASCNKLTLEEVDDLLKPVYTTLDIQEEKMQLSIHNRVYQGLEEAKHRVFTVIKVLTER